MGKKFHEKSFWQSRYDGETPDHLYDWYIPYNDAVQEIVHREIPREARVLTIGCGNSLMPEQMHAEGYHDMVSTDYVDTVVERMAERCGDLEGLTFEAQDARDLTYPDESFDAVIDKGTIDASDMGPDNLPNICKQARRVLKPGGVFLCISIMPPVARTFFLGRPEYGWTLTHHTLPSSPTAAYAYVMRLPRT